MDLHLEVLGTVKRDLRGRQSRGYQVPKDEMAERFPGFAASPPPVQHYIRDLKPTLTRLPLRPKENAYLLNFIGSNAFSYGPVDYAEPKR